MQMLKPAGIGHFNEFLGQTQSTASDLSIASHWQSFIEHLGVDGFTDLDPRTELLERQIRDNGVTYNVYADSSGPQRPWSLDLLPLIIDQISWQQIQTGVLQRVKLLDRIVSDVYGPQTLLKNRCCRLPWCRGILVICAPCMGINRWVKRICMWLHLICRVAPMVIGGLFLNACKHHRDWVIC